MFRVKSTRKKKRTNRSVQAACVTGTRILLEDSVHQWSSTTAVQHLAAPPSECCIERQYACSNTSCGCLTFLKKIHGKRRNTILRAISAHHPLRSTQSPGARRAAGIVYSYISRGKLSCQCVFRAQRTPPNTDPTIGYSPVRSQSAHRVELFELARWIGCGRPTPHSHLQLAEVAVLLAVEVELLRRHRLAAARGWLALLLHERAAAEWAGLECFVTQRKLRPQWIR